MIMVERPRVTLQKLIKEHIHIIETMALIGADIQEGVELEVKRM